MFMTCCCCAVSENASNGGISLKLILLFQLDQSTGCGERAARWLAAAWSGLALRAA
jgi:hypothetical protein